MPMISGNGNGLHASLLAAGYFVRPEEKELASLGPSTRDAISHLQRRAGLPVTGEPNERTLVALAQLVEALKRQRYSIEGRAVTDDGYPAAAAAILVRRFALGKADTVADNTQTDENGYFSLAFDHPDAESPIVALYAKVDGTEHALEEPAFQRERHVVRDVVVAAKLVPLKGDEYTRLHADLGNASLPDLEESATRKDITLLAEKTRWDRRAIALHSTAARLAKSIGAPEKALYALLRCGFSTEPAGLALLEPKTIGDALANAVKAGIVSMNDAERREAVARLDRGLQAERRKLRPAGGVSTLGDLLAATPIDDAQRGEVEKLFVKHAHDAKALMKTVTATMPEAAAKIAVAGKLAYATGNSAALMKTLTRSLGIQKEEDLSKLAVRHHDAAAWTADLEAIANGDANVLAGLIPERYTGANTRERLDRYAADMARLVRVSYPTHVLAARVAAKELGDLGGVSAHVATVLGAAAAAGAEITGASKGKLAAFFHEHGDGLVPNVAERALVKEALFTLQRLHQITPSHTAMKALHAEGFRSAGDVTSFDLATFKQRFGANLDPMEVELVYRKAQQVTAVTRNVVTTVKQLSSSGLVAAVSPPAVEVESKREAAKEALKKEYPSLDTLFGSNDFCPCEHCQSMLSPSAYLVDLFQFLDTDPDPQRPSVVWQSNKDAWAARNGKPYPGKTPFEELVDRRPDLPLIPLTCENTHTELPFIDVMNEILECWVVNGKVTADAAHDTGAANSGDLIAEPQYVIEAAYDELADPQPLPSAPFDLPLERVRAFLGRFETPWFRALEVMTDPTDLPKVEAVALESVGIGPKEIVPFTNREWFELYGYVDAASATAALIDAQKAGVNAKKLARVVGVTQAELIEIVRTKYVNPQLSTLVYLRKAGLTSQDALAYRMGTLSATDKTAFEQKLAALNYPGFNWNAAAFDQIVVLHDTSPSCLFDGVTLRFIDGDVAKLPDVLHRVALFARLWKKLGWSAGEVDLLLDAASFGQENDRKKAWRSTLVAAGFVRELAERLDVAKEDVLTFFTNIPTMGGSPLYDRLFLRPTVIKTDPAFDTSPSGLLAAGAKIGAHLAGVQAALGTSAAEIQAVVGDPANADLTLATLSKIRRHVVLARALAMPVTDLVFLIGLSALDPFPAFAAQVPTTVADIGPLSKTIAFLDVVQVLRDAELSVEAIAYVVSHRGAAGAFAELDRTPDALVRSLADALRRIEVDTALPTEGELTAEMLRPKLTMVLPANVVDTFLGMWSGAGVFEVKSGPKLVPSDYASFERLSVRDDHFLQHRGAVTPKVQAALKAGLAGAGAKQLVDELAAQVVTLLNELSPILTGADANKLFPDVRDAAALDAQRDELVKYLAPYLRKELRRRAVVAEMANDLKVAAGVVQALVTSSDVLADSSNAPLLETLAGVNDLGLDATFVDGSGAVLATRRLTGAVPTSSIPGGTVRVTMDGYFDVPVTGATRFIIKLGTGVAAAKLHVDGLVVAAANGPLVDGSVALDAGRLHRLQLEADLDGKGIDVSVEVPGKGRTPLASLGLFSAAAVDGLRGARIVLAKLTHLASTFAFDAGDLRVLAAGSPFAIPTGPGINSGDAASLLGRITMMARYSRTRRAVPLTRTRAMLEAATAAELKAAARAAFARDAATVESLVSALGIAPRAALPAGPQRLAELERLLRDVERLQRGAALVRKLGVAVSDLTTWTSGSVNWAVSRDVRDVIRAKYSDSAWRTFAKPVFDDLRKRQRDALVAYILQKQGLSRVEELFESFLLDAATEPAVLTSRIQLATASVQTFIQRSFLNLEPKVPAGILDAKRWSTLKRYRVSEAAKKILIWPENWLEPELRDDVTHLAAAAFGELLQGDVDRDLVEDAFVRYLEGLEEIARLEIVSLFVEPRDAIAKVLHVVGRTYAKSAKYFYRSFADNMWTPWVPITATIEGDHVAVAKWRDRIHVFWLSMTDEKENSSATTYTPEELSTMKTSAIAGTPATRAQLNWVELLKGKWVNRKSSGFLPPSAKLASGMTVDLTTKDGAITFHLTNAEGKGAALLLRNKNSKVQIVDFSGKRNFPVSLREPLGPTATGFSGSLALQSRFSDGKAGFSEHTVLTLSGGEPKHIATVVPPSNVRDLGPLPLGAPFFFQDHSNTFLVQPWWFRIAIPAWDGWVVPFEPHALEIPLEVKPIKPQRPRPRVPLNVDPVPPLSIGDWLFDTNTSLPFGRGSIAGAGGRS